MLGMDTELCAMPIKIVMRVIGLMIRDVDKVYNCIMLVTNMLDS